MNFRAAMLVAPTADEEVDALPTVSMVALPDELLQHIVRQACNPLEPLVAVYLSSASHGLWALTPALLQQLRADYEVAIRLCRKLGLPSCKVLREAKEFDCCGRGLTADLALLGTLGLVLPALETLILFDPAAGPDGVQRLAERLGAGVLPSVTVVELNSMHVGDAGTSALAAALGRGAMPRLKRLDLFRAAIGDAGLLALAPALRLQPALEALGFSCNPFGDEGLAALLAPPPLPAGAPPPTGVLTRLKLLDLSYTQITNAGCAALAAALDSGTLPALEELHLYGVLARGHPSVLVRGSRGVLVGGVGQRRGAP